MKKLCFALFFLFVACTNSNNDEFAINYQDMHTTTEKFIVVYNANGAYGTIPIDTNVYNYNDTVTVMPNTNLRQKGFIFIGWSFCSDCTQNILKPGYTFTITSSTILYACFTNEPVYSVTYCALDADSGYPPIDSNYYISSEKAYIKANTGKLTKAGYRFSGWFHQPSQTIYQPGQYITVENADIQLHAYFIPKPLKVTYRPNGANSGTVPHDGLYYDEGDIVTIAHNTGNLAIINFDGASYCFDYWVDSYGNIYYPGGTYTMLTSLVLDACYRPYRVGDTGPAGGIVFYIKDDYSDNWRYLEAMRKDVLQTGIVWEEQIASGQYRQTGTTAVEIGAGLPNTQLCIQVLGEGNYAAKVCSTISTGNYFDWHLPSKDELNILYQNKAMIGNFTSYNYWSSSESTTSKAWCQNLSTGSQNTQYKNNTYRVRAIRRF